MKIENRIVEVSNSGEHWKRQVLVVVKDNIAYCWDGAETLEEVKDAEYIARWKYWREIQEPKYRPFNWEERDLLIGKWVKGKDKAKYNNLEALITGFYNSNFSGLNININNSWVSAEKVLKEYIFLDETPCGVKE